MRQQINLYQPILREEPRLFGATTALRALVAVLVALGLIWGYGTYKVRRLEATTASFREMQQAQEKALASASTMSALRVMSVDLAARVKRAEAEVLARTRALDLLRAGVAGRTTGFADRLEALARRHTDGVWIDHMALSGTTGAMSLGGATMNPDLVPRYLQNLAQESVLAGSRFDQFVIDRPKGKHRDPSQVRFQASSLELPARGSAENDAEGAT